MPSTNNMALNLYDTTIIPIKNMLNNLSVILQKAESYADEKSLPHSDFTDARLIEDMYPLTQQVITCCNSAKFLPVRLVGHPDQVFEDDQKTFAELRERIAATVKFLDGVKREEFDQPDILTKDIQLRDRIFRGGLEYVNVFVMPNIFFHVVSAYGILRSKGVPIGKLDYILAAVHVDKVEATE